MWEESTVASEQPPWHPDPGWIELPSRGLSGSGLWLAQSAGRPWVVKRLTRPLKGDPAPLSQPKHFGYWRREADVALEASLQRTPGLRAPEVLRVDEDDEGVSVWQAVVDQAPTSGLFRAQALGRFSKADLEPRHWWADSLLVDRLAAAEQRGGWPTLARTTFADAADRLWQLRRHHLATLAALPRVPAHGDATPANLRGVSGQDVEAVDWGAFGLAPLGFDIGYLSLSEREDFDVLLKTYVEAAQCSRPHAIVGARIVAVYTIVTKAELVLAKAAATPGALAGKYRHPTVAPTLRSLQRLFPQVESLLSPDSILRG